VIECKKEKSAFHLFSFLLSFVVAISAPSSSASSMFFEKWRFSL
jgi:hypothetical protein